MLRLSLAALLVAQYFTSATPDLQFEAPENFAALRERLESQDTSRLADISRLVGLTSAGAPIRIELARENSEWAAAVPPWVAGFAVGAADMVVIFPSRSPSYPSRTLDDVLRHEVAHILIHRAAGGNPVPRWFNEGLALAAEHGWRLGDQTQLLYQLISGPRHGFSDLNGLFEGGRTEQTRAYLLSGAIVRDLLNRHGQEAGAGILERMRAGRSFEAAFADVTLRSTASAEAAFWDRQRVWTTWVSVLFSQETLWMAVTVLAILAIRRRRRKNAEIEKRWAEEDERSLL